MSNSYKKEPVMKIIYADSKKFASKKIRRTNGHLKSGGFYRKIYSSYDIFGQCSRISKQKYEIDYVGNSYEFNWEKWYHRK